MSRVEVSASGKSFTLDGSRWFYLADTAWSAITNPTDDEWERYLDLRAEQGFTAIQINMLPQWDRSPSPIDLHPFGVASSSGDAERYDFSTPNEKYFTHASRRLAAVRERGMIPAVVLLWCNYVPDTWASQRLPENIIPEDALEAYLRIALKAARPHDPIWFVSGDTDFQTERAVSYYRRGLELARELDPKGLTTLHLNGNRHEIAPSLQAMDELDFYNFQSGHGADHWHHAHHLAREFRAKSPVRPIVNAEPCYEGHGLGHSEGRFTAQQVRQAAWQGILAGASAGVTYGAHGVWSWHRQGLPFGSADFSNVPYSWDEALYFRGADDYSYIRYIVGEYGLYDLEPLTLDGVPDSIIAATSADGSTTMIYEPYGYDIAVSPELAGRSWLRVDLETRAPSAVQSATVDGVEHLWKGRYNGDALLIGR